MLPSRKWAYTPWPHTLHMLCLSRLLHFVAYVQPSYSISSRAPAPRGEGSLPHSLPHSHTRSNTQEVLRRKTEPEGCCLPRGEVLHRYFELFLKNPGNFSNACPEKT